ncbi:HAMP domain-containing histidine kinase [Clostridiaceae bacterium 68-1-5]|uniref:histidine kinase n=1 Tax=Suipraeoptans intestinalis TaxID=2606628 RepID=A0A6N7V0V9_9FIRM|nr:HAMP domain-containing sensor histidine kinase [Suipraeoptans intestinalis]MSR93787.1 HAMP domain-containing histidine kinase [Suipraeoptans intestinalis]
MKKKWYCSGITKGLLILTAHALAVILALDLFLLASYPELFREWLTGRPAKTYENSVSFGDTVEQSARELLDGVAMQEKFGGENVKESTDVIDVKAYVEEGVPKPEESSGLEYRLSDLYQWGDQWEKEGEDSLDPGAAPPPIVVCQKQGGGYRYFWYENFAEEIKSGNLQFVEAKEMGGDDFVDQVLVDLKRGNVQKDNEMTTSVIQDKEGKVVYTNFWSYDGLWIQEKYPPQGKADILEIANENPDWNGKLETAYQLVRSAAYQVKMEADSAAVLEESYREGDTNLAYLYCNFTAGTVKTNRTGFENADNWKESLKQIRKMGRFVIVTDRLEEFETNIKRTQASGWRAMLTGLSGKTGNDLLAIGVDTHYPIQDKFYQESRLFGKYGHLGNTLLLSGCIASVLFLGILIWLTTVAGRKPEDDDLHYIFLDRLPIEILLAGFFLGTLLITAPVLEMGGISGSYYPEQGESISQIYYSLIPEMVVMAMGAVALCGWFFVTYLSIVRKIKGKQVWRNSVTGRLCRFTRTLFRNLNQVWKTILLFLGFILMHWIIIAGGIYQGTLVLLIMEGAVFVYLIRRELSRKKIQKGIQEIAEGKVSYKVPLEGLKGDMLRTAEQVNAIGNGFDTALEENLKNERMKTELITNVSHDIKTPLTSIINYAGLLKKEKFEDPKIQKYLDIIEEKSQRLKTITEDVVEASKASSGNITLECMNINLVEMIQQVSGEFEERFQERRMEEVLCLPEKETVVYVDGRRMWRVLENIYSNVTKYGMEGTRVYTDLKIQGGNQAVFCLKNVSRNPLNIPAEELTERFIRGDISRSTEGSGLGLSIAKSLTELQGGTFDVYVDGDLFKVTIRFPLQARRMPCREEESPSPEKEAGKA